MGYHTCIAAMIAFSQSSYNAEEDSRSIQAELFLSNPSSTDITVELFSSDGSATGKH